MRGQMELRREEKKRFVRKKFAAVTKRYDFLNAFLSMYIDHYWRNKTADSLGALPSGPLLDLCAGTLPLAETIVRRRNDGRQVVAVDFCLEMLQQGVQRLSGSRWLDSIVPVCGDGELLPFPDRTFSGITIAFGIRNLGDQEKGLQEMHRVLVPGGRLLILEFSRPKTPIFGALYSFYLHKVLPVIGGWISGDREAYQYLATSIQGFYDPPLLAGMMEAAGFQEVRFQPLSMGIVTLYSGTKGK